MTVAFLGLTGTQGVLPFCYTERMIAREGGQGRYARGILRSLQPPAGVFVLSRLGKAPPAGSLRAERGAGPNSPDPFTHSLFDLIGMGTDGLRGRMRIQDESLLAVRRPDRAAAALGERRCAAFFGTISRCRWRSISASASWYELEEADRCYLSAELERNQLGEGAFLGDEVWNQQARFRIRVGPLGLNRFMEFLPDGRAMAKLVELTRYLVGQAMAFDVQVFLRAERGSLLPSG